MKTTLKTVLAAALALGFTASAQAGNWDPRVNHMQRHQAYRIADGVADGSLTRSETQALRAKERAIRQEERAYKADGNLTRDERTDLRRDMRQASRDIYREKHDAETR